MTSSIQQIEAAIAYVQAPPDKQRRGPQPAVSSCSFNLAAFEPTGREIQAAARLAQVTPPPFCKPLSKIGSAALAQQARQPRKQHRGRTKAVPRLTGTPAGALSYRLTPSPKTLTEPSVERSVERSVETATKPVTTIDLDPSTPGGQDMTVQTHPSENSPGAAASAKASAKIRPIHQGETPGLPRSKPPKFTSHRNGSNPMLPLNLLQDIGREVVQWQTQLKRVHDAIQTLYGEGPIINAWLESAVGVKTEAKDLPEGKPVSADLSDPLSGQYHLCGVDKHGQVWRKLCPTEQLPQVTVAIARHQRLRQLLSQKRSIDERLQRLSQTLTMLRGSLRAY